MNDTPLRTGVGVFIPYADREMIETIADERGVCISDVIRVAVSHYLDVHDERLGAGRAT